MNVEELTAELVQVKAELDQKNKQIEDFQKSDKEQKETIDNLRNRNAELYRITGTGIEKAPEKEPEKDSDEDFFKNYYKELKEKNKL